MKVKEIMRKNVITVAPDTPVKELAKTLIENDITGAPVVKNNRIVGIVTEADLITRHKKIHIPTFIQLLEGRIYLENPKEIEMQLKKIFALKAKDLMSKKVITMSPEDSVEDLSTLILKKHINPVPIVENNELVGIVSRADIVKLISKE